LQKEARTQRRSERRMNYELTVPSSSSIAEQVKAMGQAIKDQQHAASAIAGALASLAMETERMAVRIQPCDSEGQALQDGLHGADDNKELDIVPQCKSAPLAPIRSIRRAWTPSAVGKSTSVCITNSQHNRASAVRKCAQTVAAMKTKQSHGHLFADPDDLRDQIRENLTDEIFDVSEWYKDRGICQAVVRSNWFETASLTLVVLSSVWMAVEIDHNDSGSLHKADAIFQIVSHLLCLLFFTELCVRIFAFRHPRYAFKDRWIVFDAVLVALLVFDVWVLGTIAAVADRALAGDGLKLIVVFRVLRLLRILRLARVFHHLPELMVIVRGLGRALRAILVVIVLIGLTIYVAAMVFTVLLEGSALGREHFTTVGTSMATLMLDCTLSGARGTALMRAAWDVHPLFGMLVLFFVLVSNITMLGVLTGLLVQTVKTVAEVEKEEKSVRMLVRAMEDLWSYMLRGDTDDDGKIDMGEFSNVMKLKETARVMAALDVDVEGLASVSAFVFGQNQSRLGRKDFLQMVLDVRSSKKATVKDHIETRKFTQAALRETFKNVADRSGEQRD